MAQALRHTLKGVLSGTALRQSLSPPGLLAVAGMALVVLPLLPGLAPLLAAQTAQSWQALFSDDQTLAALRVTLVSALLSTGLATVLALLVTASVYPGAAWSRLQRRLPAVLALPHAAYAIGAFFLLSPSGWLARLISPLMGWDAPPDVAVVRDAHGVGLGLLLGLKEALFLLWVLAAVLQEGPQQRQMTLLRSMGYRSGQIWLQVLLPQLLPRLAWPLLAVLAYSVSVVDVALILGPGSPPSLAVLAWRWLYDGDAALQAQGAAATALLLGVFLALVGLAGLLWRALLLVWRQPGGRRWPARGPRGPVLSHALMAFFAAVALVIALWSVAGPWFFPDVLPSRVTLQGWQDASLVPLWTALVLGAGSALLGAALVLLWLDFGPRTLDRWLYLPLIVPALPLAAGQYHAVLLAGLSGHVLTVLWAHLLWVIPYMLLTLAGPHAGLDPRLMSTARSLGLSRWQTSWRVRWPLLLRPILAALAIGFAVSVAQYLPTLFAGGGRVATVTTEAVALSSGGNRRTIAVQAALQMLLPLAVFAAATLAGQWAGRQRRSWR
ncbi:ABC transporter permease [Amphibiibacter pelophylacis]|uniref:ABC transporter permease n=1 Tax=Amphibiibacter pelophylacis TaxID=1799477 RepID=A0ACC6NZD1_9BURK